MRNFALSIALVAMAILVGWQLQIVGQASAANNKKDNKDNKKIEICHRTSNPQKPYEQKKVSKDSITDRRGHKSHTGPVWNSSMNSRDEWGDIIPKFDNFKGLNWTEKGKAIWENDCKIPKKKPKPVDCRWGDYGSCQYFDQEKQCGEGKQYRSIEQEAKNGGRACSGKSWKFCYTECEHEEPNGNGGIDPSPTPTPTPSPTSPKISAELYKEKIKCEDYRLRVRYELKKDDQPIEGVKVVFEYKGKKAETKTNEKGIAGASYDFKGADVVTAEVDGYPDREMKVRDVDCPATGSVLGDSTGEEPATYAATGTFVDTLAAVLGLEGVVTTAVGTYLYGKKRAAK